MSSEDSLAYDGPFSTYTEWHAFIIGAGVGFAAVMPSAKLRRFVFGLIGFDNGLSRTETFAEAKRESWYALGGVIVGAAFAAATLGIMFTVFAHGLLGGGLL